MKANSCAARAVAPVPKVSVLMLTYNHERYVAQALETALAQRAPFPFEIVVGEDCSGDRTRDIVLETARRHPNRVQVLPRSHRLGMMRNFAVTLEACRGDYVALLDGDDYWTCELKLVRQAEFLDAHPGCSFCFHDYECLDEEHAGRGWVSYHAKTRYTLEDLLAGNVAMASSVMFRRGLFGPVPPWVLRLPFADWPLHVLNAQYGDGCYLNYKMAVYRLHANQAWIGLPRIRVMEQDLEAYRAFEKHVRRGDAQLIARIGELCLRLKDLHEQAGNRKAARRYAWRYVWKRPLDKPVSTLVRGLIRLYLGGK